MLYGTNFKCMKSHVFMKTVDFIVYFVVVNVIAVWIVFTQSHTSVVIYTLNVLKRELQAETTCQQLPTF